MAHLHHEAIFDPGATPNHLLVMTHGMFGSGGNWRGIARQLVKRRPDWKIILVDLRGHGRSELGDPPHDVAACAGDLVALLGTLESQDLTVDAIAGHSFGGKVCLATRALVAPRQTWILDASPGAQPADPMMTRVLALLERLPKTWATRDAFVAAVLADGHELAFARWLAMNVVDGRLRLDVAAMAAMIADYKARDLWATLDAPGGDVEVVIADRSAVVTGDDQRRLAASPPHVHVHHVAAGHWLHVDDPAAIVELFARLLPA